MENPWAQLPLEPDFVLPDRPSIAEFNAIADNNHRIHLDSGPRWWATHLHSLLPRIGRERLAKSMLCVEFFPYHSSNYPSLGTTLDSQQYSFWLVRQAMEAHAVIVGLRGRAYWDGAIPELADYRRSYWLKNRQRVWVTPGNCPDDSYEGIVRALST